MFIGSRITNEAMFELPYLFFILLRSSKSLSITISCFTIGKFVKTKQGVKARDLIFSVITAAGLVVFNLDVKSYLSRTQSLATKRSKWYRLSFRLLDFYSSLFQVTIKKMSVTRWGQLPFSSCLFKTFMVWWFQELFGHFLLSLAKLLNYSLTVPKLS